MFVEWTIDLKGTQYFIRFEHVEDWSKGIYILKVNNVLVVEHKYNLIGPRLPLKIPIALNEQVGDVFVQKSKSRQHIFAELCVDGKIIPTSDATPGWETGNLFDK